MTDHYCVIGNPVAHSKSPMIHAEFARQTGQDLAYDRILAPLDGFAAAVNEFIAQHGRGLNVTVPFKQEAWRIATRLTERARDAGAVNTLKFAAGEILGDNTDGAGLVRDIGANLKIAIDGRRVLLLGAGGAARGVIAPLLDANPARLVIANRTVARALQLAQHFGRKIEASSYADLANSEHDIVINATSSSLSGELPPLPPGVFADGAVAYDMMYGKGLTPFLSFAEGQGAAILADGLGMLVEQAAESFLLWRGIRPDTRPVYELLRSC